MQERKFCAFNKLERTIDDPFTLQSAFGARKTDGVDTSEVEYMQFTGLKDKIGKAFMRGHIRQRL